MIKDILHLKFEDVPSHHDCPHEGYESYRRNLVPKGEANQCAVTVYEVPPGKSAIPYHYHVKNEEAFYIISGEGILKAPLGDRQVKAGDFLFFPANENGAHKLTNSSDTEMLVYLDFDTSNEINDIEVAFYPDSGKIGVWGKDINKIYKQGDSVEYFEGE